MDRITVKDYFPDRKWISLADSLPVPAPKEEISLFSRKNTGSNHWTSTNTTIDLVSAKSYPPSKMTGNIISEHGKKVLFMIFY